MQKGDECHHLMVKLHSQDGAIVIKKALHEMSADTQEVAGGGGKSYGRQVSVQELFDGKLKVNKLYGYSPLVLPPFYRGDNLNRIVFVVLVGDSFLQVRSILNMNSLPPGSKSFFSSPVRLYRKSYCTTPGVGVGSGSGIGMGKMLKFLR